MCERHMHASWRASRVQVECLLCEMVPLEACAKCVNEDSLQGYLAHKKQTPP